MRVLKRILKSVAAWPVSLVTRYEYQTQRFKRHNERPVELAFLFRHLARLAPETVLDVGTGTTALPHLIRNCGPVVTAIDNVTDYWRRGMVNRHFHVIDDDIRDSKLAGTFDLVVCLSVLEHIDPADAAVASMLARVSPGGHLLLTFPYTEDGYVPNVYDLPGSRGARMPYVTQSFSRQDVTRWCAGAELVEQEYWRFWTGRCWTDGDLITPPHPATATTPHQHACVLMRKR